MSTRANIGIDPATACILPVVAMRSLLALAAELDQWLSQQHWPYSFIVGIALLTCSAEDLVILKAFADRTRDWADIETVILRQADCLDWAYIDRELPPLCELKGVSEIVDRLRRLRKDR